MFLHKKVGLINRIVHLVVNGGTLLLLALLTSAATESNPGHLFGPY